MGLPVLRALFLRAANPPGRLFAAIKKYHSAQRAEELSFQGDLLHRRQELFPVGSIAFPFSFVIAIARVHCLP
jgi:hypothetical protein